MRIAPFLTSSGLAGALVALGSFNACSTTQIVDVPFDGGAADAPVADESDAAADSSVVDAAPAIDANDGKCHPLSGAGFTGEPYAPPTGSHQGLCTDLQIKSYVDCANGVTAACADLNGDGGPTCKGCIESRSTNAKWGPLVQTNLANVELNEAGCAAILNSDTGTTGCGQAEANYTGCLHYACRSSCPDAEYYACAVEARSTSCKAYSTKGICTADATDCFAKPADGPNDLVTRLIKLFCGTM